MQGCDGPKPLDIFESTFITTAYALAKRGFAVTLFERHGYAAMETSFANGGQLSASNAEVWTHWSTILKGLRWMLKSDAPLLVNGVDRDILVSDTILKAASAKKAVHVMNLQGIAEANF
jgi:flavin-dependent dehydrogenase